MKKLFVITGIVILFITVLLFVIYKLCWTPKVYSNNLELEPDENDEIKKLILLSIKDLFYCPDHHDIYVDDNDATIIQLDDNVVFPKSHIVLIDRDFMNGVQKKDNLYVVVVEVYYPTAYFCEITILKTENGYKIKSFLLDI